MTEEYRKHWMQQIADNAEMRRIHQAEMIEERDRIISLFQKRGIPVATRYCDRMIRISYFADSYCYRIDSTCFQIPEDIDLEKVVRWFVFNTKFKECTVFLDGWNPTTINDESGIQYFFKYAPAAHDRYLAQQKEDMEH